MELSQLLTWQADREVSDIAHREYLDLRLDLDGLIERRDACREALASALGAAGTDVPLSPLLAASAHGPVAAGVPAEGGGLAALVTGSTRPLSAEPSSPKPSPVGEADCARARRIWPACFTRLTRTL
ncbi:hypothetical protein [Aquabacter spiritensis]|uniref:hypothetical protein n=1 Tax=Aquabacter spiritensis TaxID=933073 RepID=UPI00104A8B8B|nr:hypothetical protein [Aquabacter spiritensis]